VKELVQHNKVRFSELLDMFSRAVHQFNAMRERIRGNRAIF